MVEMDLLAVEMARPGSHWQGQRNPELSGLCLPINGVSSQKAEMKQAEVTSLLTWQSQKARFLVFVPGLPNPEAAYYLPVLGGSVVVLCSLQCLERVWTPNHSKWPTRLNLRFVVQDLELLTSSNLQRQHVLVVNRQPKDIHWANVIQSSNGARWPWSPSSFHPSFTSLSVLVKRILFGISFWPWVSHGGSIAWKRKLGLSEEDRASWWGMKELQ